MTGELSTYKIAGQQSDQLAKNLRRLVALVSINVFEEMSDAQVTDVLSRTGAVDVAAATQAAIDSAFTQRISATILPSGRYRWASAVYLDPIGNMRSSGVSGNPNFFNFSMALVGDRGIGNYENQGTEVRTLDPSNSGLWVGPGQGMYVSGITFRYEGTMNVDRFILGAQKTLPTTCVGISIAGGTGGSSQWLDGTLSAALGSTAHSIAVCGIATANGVFVGLGSNSFGLNSVVGYSGGNTWFGGWGQDPPTYAGSASRDSSAHSIIKTWSNPSTLAGYIHNSSDFSASIGGAYNLTNAGITLGRQVTGQTFAALSGNICEVLVFASALSSGSRSIIDTSHGTYWGAA